MWKLFFICFVVMSAVGCKRQSDEEKILATCKQVVDAIKSGNEQAFEALLNDHSWKEEKARTIQSDFQQCKMFYDKYRGGKDITINITDEYNEVGSRRVVIPFFDGSDSCSNVAVVRLELYFGPASVMPLNKMFRYELVYKPIFSDTKMQPAIMISEGFSGLY